MQRAAQLGEGPAAAPSAPRSPWPARHRAPTASVITTTSHHDDSAWENAVGAARRRPTAGWRTAAPGRARTQPSDRSAEEHRREREPDDPAHDRRPTARTPAAAAPRRPTRTACSSGVRPTMRRSARIGVDAAGQHGNVVEQEAADAGVTLVQLDRPRPRRHGRAGRRARAPTPSGSGAGRSAGPRQPHPDAGAQPGEQDDRHGSAFTQEPLDPGGAAQPGHRPDARRPDARGRAASTS